jgi:hypothetical protein
MKRIALFAVVVLVIGLAGVSESLAGRNEKRDSRHHDRIENSREIRDDHLSRQERIRLEHRQDPANRHNYRMRHNYTNRFDRDYYDDDISFRKSAVMVPVLLPPLPPLPLVFPGMHIRIFSSR